MFDGSGARAMAVELVQWQRSLSDARGARAMAVELMRWQWSPFDGGGASAMAVCDGGGDCGATADACLTSMLCQW